MGSSLDNLAANIRKMVDDKKMTLADLAEKTTLSPVTIDRIVNKRGNPSWATVSILAEYFKVDTSVLTSPPKIKS